MGNCCYILTLSRDAGKAKIIGEKKKRDGNIRNSRPPHPNRNKIVFGFQEKCLCNGCIY